VGAVAGLVRLVRRPLGPQDGAAGLSAALVPVAVPLVAAPALVMLGLGAGADLGVLVGAGCLALAVGAITALATAPVDAGRWPVVSAWGQRLVAAAAVVACVLLVVDAVFAI
jgi:hypothetical protein